MKPIRQVKVRPVEWVVDGLVPRGHATSLVGDGGVGKTVLSFVLGTSICTGTPFLSREVSPGVVAFVDGETSESIAAGNAARVAAGMGIEAAPAELFYQFSGPIVRPCERKQLGTATRGIAASLVILDSGTSLFAGADQNDAAVMSAILTDMREQFGTVLLVDHLPKPQRDGGARLSATRAIGSTSKWNLSRSVLFLSRVKGGALELRQLKNNFGPLAEPVQFRIEFVDDGIRVVPVEVIARPATLPASVALDLVKKALTAEPQTANALRDATGLELSTVRGRLSDLKASGHAHNVARGQWVGVEP